MRIHVPEEQRGALDAPLAEAQAHLERREFRQAATALDKAVHAATGLPADPEAELRLGRADVAMQLGRWTQVLEDVDRVVALDGELADRMQFVRARLLGARIQGYYGRYREAERLLNEARDRVEEHGDRTDKALVYLELGGLHNKIGQQGAGQRELQKARLLAGDAVVDPRTAQVAVLLALEDGLAAFRQGKSDEAKRIYEGALSIARQYSPKSQWEADCYRFLGVVSSVQGRYVEALRNHLRALEIYKELGAQLGQAKVYGSIGQALLELSRVDEALFALNRARKLAVKLGADTEKASLYGKLGTIYREREEFDRAVEFHLKDVELARRFGNERALAFAFRNLGLSYRARGEGDEARSYLGECLERFQNLGDKARVAQVGLDLAEVFLDQGRPKEAEEEIAAARELMDANQATPELARLHLLHGIMLRELRRTNEAGRELVRAVQLLSGQQASAMLAEANYELARLYQLTSDNAKAVEHLKTALTLSRQLGLNRLTKSVVGLLEQINELELIRLVVQEVEREAGL